MDEPADAGDHQQHHDRELIDLQRVVGAEGARGDPGEIRVNPGNLAGVEASELANHLGRGQERKPSRAERDAVGCRARPAPAENAVGRRAEQGQQRNDPEMFEHEHSVVARA